MRRLRRSLPRIACALLLGLLTTVAVAWSLAAWLPQRGWVENRGSVEGRACVLFWSEYTARGAQRRCWDLEHPAADRMAPFELGIDSPVDGEQKYDGVPSKRSWSRLDQVCSDLADAPQDGCEHATGWPWLAASCEYQVRNAPPWTVVTIGGIELRAGRYAMLTAYTRRALPLRPIWLGLLEDVGVFGLMWSTLVEGARALHRSRRRRRGLCAACAYDRRGLASHAACPECGTPPG
jgi:hypothetical protein